MDGPLIERPGSVGGRDAPGARPGRGRIKRDRAEVRRGLIDAATRLFASRGFDRVNSNEIARAAGVGVGTFYQHFDDKLEAHQGVVLETLESLRGEIARTAASPGGDVETQVQDLVEAVVAFAEGNPERFRVAFSSEHATLRTTPKSSRGDATQRPQVSYSTRVTERRLADLRDAGLLDPALNPKVAARAFVAMQNGVLCWWLDDQSRATRDAVVKTLVRLHPAVAGAR
jgi:AcrR family transcriptional regulator